MHDIALTFLVSALTIGLVVGIYIAVLSAIQGPLK